MDTRLSYTLVGLFVVVLLSALVTVGVWLAAPTGDIVYHTYATHMTESVSGLNKGGEVKYRGVEVGEVREIALEPGNPEQVRLLLDIREGTPIKTDTRATLAMQGITGLLYVDLTGGSREAPALEPRTDDDASYPEIPADPSLLVRLDQAVSSALADLSKVAAEMENVAVRVNNLLSEDNRLAVGGTLSNVERITANLASRMESLGQGLEALGPTLQNVAKASDELPALLGEVRRSVSAVQDTVASFSRTAGSVERLVEQSRQELSRFTADTVAPMDQLMVELRQLAATLQRLGEDLDRNPNMLLFGRPNPPPGPGE
jgi:phospholipid/cholesterol/gamma-HCH transport system substrate-binding protein